MDQTDSFGYWVRRRRKALDLTQAQLARYLGCAVITLQKIEADERRPSRQMAELLAEHLAVPDSERASFILSARGERSIDRIPLSTNPVATETPPAYQHNLPTPPNAFVGRERALSDVHRLLLASRLLTLTGPGGTGKTRLALQFTSQLATDTPLARPPQIEQMQESKRLFPDGICFVQLAAVQDSSLVAQTIATALGIAAVGQATPQSALERHLRQKQLLLLLDNFEHLIAAAPLVGELLAAAPGLKIMVTSREALRVYGEQEYYVPPMALPPQEPRTKNQEPGPADHSVVSSSRSGALWAVLGSVSNLAQYESVALFLERARAVKPDFQLTAENAAAIAEICTRLDGLPLAIELAAARIRLFTPQALLRRLDTRLGALVDGPRDLPARQQTLRSAIGWSYDLLSPKEQVLFAQLGVFVGGWTLEAAQAVLRTEGRGLSEETAVSVLSPQSSVLDRLASLAHKSLIQQHESLDGEPRFSILETIREFALERLVERGATVALRRRHLAYYTALAESAVPQFFGAEQAAYLARLEQEQANMRAALSWSLASEDQQNARMSLRLAGALGWFWHLRGYWSEGRTWLEKILASCEELKIENVELRNAQTQFSIEKAKALCAAGMLAWAQDDYAIAREHLERSLSFALPEHEPHTRAHALGLLGLTRLYQGDYAEAAPLFEESLSLFQGLDDTFGIGVSLIRLAIVANLQGDWARATDLNTQSLSFYRALGNHWGIATSLATQAEVALAQGHWRTAATCYREALPFMQALGSDWYLALLLIGIASVAIAGGQAIAAARLLGASEALAENVGGRLPPPDRQVYERNLAAARDQLGESALAAARAEGRALTPEQAVADVLAPSSIE